MSTTAAATTAGLSAFVTFPAVGVSTSDPTEQSSPPKEATVASTVASIETVILVAMVMVAAEPEIPWERNGQ